MRHGVAVGRWSKLLQWSFIVLAAFASARAIGSVVRFSLDRPSIDSRLAKAASARVDAGRRKQALDNSIILKRNLFGSEPETAIVGTAPARNVPLELRGTAELNGVGYAVFEDTEANLQDVFAVGDAIFEGPTLVSVDARTAVVSQRGTELTFEIEEKEQSASSAGSDSKTNGDNATGGIRKSGENSYLVDRREVDHAVENLSTVVTQMRAVPYMRDGKSLGFRVFNIRSGSIFERMGLKNGDVVQAINGTELNDPSKALTMLEDVQTVDDIRLDLLRDNQPTTFSYTVR